MLRFAQPFVCAVLRRNENLTILLRLHGTMMFAPVSLSSAYIAMEEVLLLSILTCCVVKKKDWNVSEVPGVQSDREALTLASS